MGKWAPGDKACGQNILTVGEKYTFSKDVTTGHCHITGHWLVWLVYGFVLWNGGWCYNSMFIFIINEWDDVQLLEVERVVGWDVIDNQKAGKNYLLKVLFVFM